MRDILFNKAFIRADSCLSGILAKFLSIAKDCATVDARGYVINTFGVYSAIRLSESIGYIYKRGPLRCHSAIDGQCEKPQREGW